ncbi:type VI secretion system lipoprotein TssJ [Moritella sp. 5]|uniref:type VI secretion system lipoprotein TssJ n=1 Tax=Moritella sp. 5 TaxID=2746231 RepID=UPI001BAB77F0|nr:type VI secretion system lipoprotein TssJ [Moritella sp. 5]QUM82093.1 type VI secretion system lipoprotein TssJ [Moritella sp. 5]
MLTAFLCEQFERVKLFIISVVLLFITACSNTYVRLNLAASADLNSNKYNEPLPVMIRVYQVSAVNAFRNVSFDQLWQADELILGTGLVDKQAGRGW